MKNLIKTTLLAITVLMAACSDNSTINKSSYDESIGKMIKAVSTKNPAQGRMLVISLTQTEDKEHYGLTAQEIINLSFNQEKQEKFTKAFPTIEALEAYINAIHEEHRENKSQKIHTATHYISRVREEHHKKLLNGLLPKAELGFSKGDDFSTLDSRKNAKHKVLTIKQDGTTIILYVDMSIQVQ